MKNPDINSIEAEIIKRKIPCFFVSPHLDDAVLSAGGLIINLAQKTKVTIVTVFTVADPPPYTFSAKRNLEISGGYSDAEDLFLARRTEDQVACNALKVNHVHLGFLDASFRKKENKSLLARALGGLFPEVRHVYPIYRLDIISGKVSKSDEVTLSSIEDKLRKFCAVGKDYAVFTPLGIGNHVDHIVTREACRKVFQNLIFWEDFPYNEKKKTFPKNDFKKVSLGSLNEYKRGEKIKIISLYKSQSSAMFPKGIQVVPESYYREFNSNESFFI